MILSQIKKNLFLFWVNFSEFFQNNYSPKYNYSFCFYFLLFDILIITLIYLNILFSEKLGEFL